MDWELARLVDGELVGNLSLSSKALGEKKEMHGLFSSLTKMELPPGEVCASPTCLSDSS